MQSAAPSPSGLIQYLPVTLAALLVAASFVSSPRPAATGPVATALKSATSTDRAKIASVYSALADVMARDSGRLIATTAIWRSIYSDALRLAVGGTDLVGKYPDLDEAVEEVLSKHYPLENVAIDSILADKIVAGVRAVESQCE
jgi:hypothetical protein